MSEEQALGFSGIYDAYHGKVVAYAAKLIGRDEAEDVAQEVFFKVSQSLGTLDDRSRLTSWIFAITLNTVRDLARRRASRAAASGTPPAQVEDPSARTPEENAVRNEMIACYLDYVKELPRDHYEVYVLSEFGDLTNPEIARRLSLPLSTVKIRLHRARAELHGELRRDCRCYINERGELMGEPKPSGESVD